MTSQVVDVNMKTLFINLILVFIISINAAISTQKRSFTYDDNGFLKDGKPFRYLSGSIHYRRVPRQYWDDRLKKLRAGGFNAVQFYLEWNIHEPERGVYNFEGNADVIEFVKIAAKNDLLVILRAGPYIDAERYMGGLPYWLLLDGSNKLRSSDPKYLAAVDDWFNFVLPKFVPYLYKNGGPIITVQVENEYGGFAGSNCDVKYMDHLVKLFQNNLGNDVILFTTDNGINNLICARTAGTMTTVDFGVGSQEVMQNHLDNERLIRPLGPLVDSEFYPGWLDNWGFPHHKVSTEDFTGALDWLLSQNVSVNVYMAHGGTSFALEAGANALTQSFSPNPTSYDYDAPISEAGDLTQKYQVTKSIAAKYFQIPEIQVSNSTKGNYGKVQVKPVTTLFNINQLSGSSPPVKSQYPMTFEQLKQDKGFVLYQTIIPTGSIYSDPCNLEIKTLHDRAHIYLNSNPVGKLTRMFGGVNNLPLSNLKGGNRLDIIVENLGRISNGMVEFEFKGILGNVTLNGKVLENWIMTSYPMNNDGQMIESIESMSISDQSSMHEIYQSQGQFSFWSGTFKIPCSDNGPKDTFVKMSNWRKGQLWINGFNLGRYWPALGPQETLYLPAPMLKSNCNETNTFTILETDSSPMKTQDQYITLIDTPMLTGPTIY